MKSTKPRKSKLLTDATDDPIELYKYFHARSLDPTKTEQERAIARIDVMDIIAFLGYWPNITA
jgi:hypothetical protein